MITAPVASASLAAAPAFACGQSYTHVRSSIDWLRIHTSPGDGLWLDISRDSQATHATCGSTSSPVTGQAWTHAFRTSSYASAAMRARGGGTSNGTVYFNCTTWW